MASAAARAHARAGRDRGRGRGLVPPAPSSTPPLSASEKEGPGHRYTIAQRIHCLSLIVEGFSGPYIEAKTGVARSAQVKIRKKAFERGFQPDQDPRIFERYVEDGARSGRPKTITPAIEQQLLDTVRADRAGREKSSEVLAYESGISCASALRILHKHGLSSVKPTRKPGLSLQQRAARLQFCLQHAHWTLEDWKCVI
jgi:Transposase